MTVDTAVAHFRTREASLMTSTVTITRSAGAGTYNSTTGGYGSVPAATSVYSGIGYCRPFSRDQATEETVVDQGVTTGRYIVKIPHTTTTVQPDDLVAVTSAGDTFPTMRVISAEVDDWVVTRRLVCERVTI